MIALRRPAPAPVLRSLVLGCATLALGACAGGDAYPSLARRPVERITGTAPVVAATPAPAPVPAGPVLDSAAAALAAARAADARFAERLPRARQLVAAARASAVASEAWAVATVAVSDLESSRSAAMVALADLDALHARSRIAGEDAAALAATRDQVAALVAGQDAALAALKLAVPR